MVMLDSRWYGVSSGNGNDGVSHLYPDYYVKTNDPWRLAELAAVSTFKDGAGTEWAKRHIVIDGEAEYTISAFFDDPPCGKTVDGEYPDLPEDVEYEDAEDGRNWSMHNGAWQIFEVFPVDVDIIESSSGLAYESLDDCFGGLAKAIAYAEDKAPLEYFINLDERGEFFADVRREDETVFQIHGFDIFEDGFMRHKDDMPGLLDYLRQLGIADKDDTLVKAN